MPILSDGGEVQPTRLSGQLSQENVNVDLTMCGLLIDRAEELVQLYDTHGNWNDVKQVWFDERLSDRSTRGSSQKIYRVLTSRLKNSPPSLPNPSDLPEVLDACTNPQDKSQILYLYLISDDALVRYVVHEYVTRMVGGYKDALDFSNETIINMLSSLRFDDGAKFDYADSTNKRWCEGFRSVMRNIGALEEQKVVGETPMVNDIPLLVAAGYSYEENEESWTQYPKGLVYLFQPEQKWGELYDRVSRSNTWESIDIHGDVQLQPVDDTYSWTDSMEELQ